MQRRTSEVGRPCVQCDKRRRRAMTNERPILIWLPLTAAQLASVQRGNSLQIEIPHSGEKGRSTSGGIELTDELIERLAAEAERGYDVKRLRTQLTAATIVMIRKTKRLS